MFHRWAEAKRKAEELGGKLADAEAKSALQSMQIRKCIAGSGKRP